MPRPFGTDRVEELPGGTVRLVCRRPKSWTPRKNAERGTPLHPGTAVRLGGRSLGGRRGRGAPGGRGALRPGSLGRPARDPGPAPVRRDERGRDARPTPGTSAVAARRDGSPFSSLPSRAPAGASPGAARGRARDSRDDAHARVGLRSDGRGHVRAPDDAGVRPRARGYRLEGPALAPFLPLLVYFLPESLLRLGIALAQDRPVGSLLGLPLYPLARATGLVGPPPESPGSAEPAEERRLDGPLL